MRPTRHQLSALTALCVTGAAGLTLAAPSVAEPLQAPTAFVVLQGGTGTEKAAAATRAAGGTVTQEWPQIGLVIAEASDDTFDDRARTMSGIVAAGPTRALHAFSAPTAPAPRGGLGPRCGDDRR